MSRLSTARRYQKAVLWPASGSFTDHGTHKLNSPVEIDVRWEDKQEEALDSLGNTITTEASVVVDREIPVGSIIWKGAEGDLPDPPTELKQVVTCKETPGLKARTFRRVVQLTRHSNELPALA